MTFWTRSKDFLTSRAFLSITGLYYSFNGIYLYNHFYKKKLEGGLAEDLIRRIEDDAKVREAYGLPITFDKGFFCGFKSHFSEKENGQEGIVNAVGPRGTMAIEFERNYVTKKDFVKANGEVDQELMKEYCIPGDEVLKLMKDKDQSNAKIPDVSLIYSYKGNQVNYEATSTFSATQVGIVILYIYKFLMSSMWERKF